jgi:hypothetical protein
MKCLHRFFQGNIDIEAVDLEEINVRRVEALQGGIDCVEDCLTGKPLPF